MADDGPADGTMPPRAANPAAHQVEAVRETAPRRVQLPRAWIRGYTAARADQLRRENEALDLPFKGGFVRSMLELEAEAERQSLIYASRSRIYGSLYYILGLPAAILAAIAGATALASTTGRVWAGIIALASSALSAAVVFLDSGKQRERAAQLRGYWDNLYNEIHVARLTKLIDYDVYSGPSALNSFYTIASSIRAGRDPADRPRATSPGAPSSGAPPEFLFPKERARQRVFPDQHHSG